MDIIAAHQQGLIEQLRLDAEALAGRPCDFAQRAATYHHLYQHSGGNHAFPLLAAHGALWGAGYFRTGMRVGKLLSHRFRGGRQAAMIEQLERFTDALREINRQVCVETYFTYRLSASPAFRDEAEARIEPVLLDALDRIHAHRRAGSLAPLADRATLFEAFFEWEQRAIVAPLLDEAFRQFEWPELHWIALRPAIRFAFLGWRPLRFGDFTSQDERLIKGVRAFERAERLGWREVERSLADYGEMPDSFCANPAQHFYGLLRSFQDRRRMQWREAADRDCEATPLAA